MYIGKAAKAVYIASALIFLSTQGLPSAEISNPVSISTKPLFASAQTGISRLPLIEKIMSQTNDEGITFKVHYIEEDLERVQDPTYPHRVIGHMTKAYLILSKGLGFGKHVKDSQTIHAFLGDASDDAEMTFAGFEPSEFKRAPIFMIKESGAHSKKVSALLLPLDYTRFLEFWDQINRIPVPSSYEEDQYLASSVMHEMTHVVTHMYNENLGSTEHDIRHGDWYTEGLARYYETKIGMDAGFASEGFRQVVGDKIQFSRGGANYYLRYPDESFFTLRYENSLFWLYFEERFGHGKVLELTTKLDQITLNANTAHYLTLIRDITGISFGDLLHDYHNWIFQEKFKKYPISEKLLTVAKTKSVWSQGNFSVYSKDGKLFGRSKILDTDWISEWGSEAADEDNNFIAGDLTFEADTKPMALDVQEVTFEHPMEEARSFILSYQGESSRLKCTVYMNGENASTMASYDFFSTSDKHINVLVPLQTTSLSIVITNYDPDDNAKYRLEIR